LATGTFQIPVTRSPDCTVGGCGREASHRRNTLCELHEYHYKPFLGSMTVDQWARFQPPKANDYEFVLVHVDERLRWEILYALQKRHARGGRIDPQIMRRVIRFMQQQPSLATMTEGDLSQLLHDNASSPNVCAHLVEFGREIRTAHDEFNGRVPKDRLIWDLVEVGISRDPSAIGGTRRRNGLDFGLISQRWLRELAMDWSFEQTITRLVTETHRVAVIASNLLEERPDRGSDPSKLTHKESDAISEAIRDAKKANGTPAKVTWKRTLYWHFFRLIEYGRRHGHLDAMPASFGPHSSHVFGSPPSTEDVCKAIPTHIQRQLDTNIDSIANCGFDYAGLSEEHKHLLFRTAYIVLRDTGRRPGEVVTLKTDYLQRDANGPILVYDNHKSGRLGRRLPVLQSTADAIEHWKAAIPGAKAAEYLFPGTTPWQDHLPTNVLAYVLRLWVKGLDRLDTNEVKKNGDPIPFDRTLIYPYAFRHSYAQRHADNGTPIDVLRDLMDHKSSSTTACYYTITADRKRKAIQTVGEYSTDRHGNAAPLTQSVRYQVQSVAVPFGNCIEPTNVKAGGQACPIRFQCAGCGFYRPDPSYLSAIEEHLNSLRADRETAGAMDIAPYVIDNLNAQITEFTNVLTTMRTRLAQLDEPERERIEEAATVLRKARAGAMLPLIVINTPRPEPQ
jgi:hypothetical protein